MGLYTQHKPFLHRDKAIYKKLMKSDRPDEVCKQGYLLYSVVIF